MIQDISPYMLDNNFYPDLEPAKGDFIMHFCGKKVLACDDVKSPFPVFEDFTKEQRYIYLFTLAEKRYFLILGNEAEIPDGYRYIEIKDVRHAKGSVKINVLAMFTAFHLFNWYRTSRYCGACSAEMVQSETERALCCKKCGNIVYPRINPAVIVGVTNGDKLLITRYAQGHGVEYDALIGGFVEIGETLEETVHREVMEETGLKVKNLRYYKSQPWGYSGGMLTGYFCDVDGDDTITIDESELSSGIWVNKEDIVGQPDDLSLTSEMMMTFKNKK